MSSSTPGREDVSDQQRWNQHGAEQLREVSKSPQRYRVKHSPLKKLGIFDDLMAALGPVPDKGILELGCGTGQHSVFLSLEGARVTGVDIGPDLISVAEAIATINNTRCHFQCGDIRALPFESDTYDAVIGIAILHHLPEDDVKLAIQEAGRVLRPGGTALFFEPVENSAAFDFLQNLIPAGRKKDKNYRPSILQRRQWAEYCRSLDDRAMSNQELTDAGRGVFETTRLIPYGLTFRLQRLFGRRSRPLFRHVDRKLFQLCPPLSHLCQNVLAIYQKQEKGKMRKMGSE